jgi:plasmid maintenance system antidote protein VapI
MAAAAAPWVEAGPFRAHLRHVMAVGDLTATEVATLAGVSPRMATSLLTGRSGRPVRRISPDTARALLRITAADARAVRARQVPAEESRLRLSRLLARGTDAADLAEQLGVTAEAVSELAAGTSRWCSALLALRLLALVRAATATELTAEPAAPVAA